MRSDMYRNIGIIGRKRSGKDTAAQALIDHLGYARHGLADPLKEAAMELDPIVSLSHPAHWSGSGYLRLSDVVESDGWEGAKDMYPEVRRILQRLGDEAGRQVHGEDTWINQLRRWVRRENIQGRPVVVPDVRYLNEAEALRQDGFLLLRIDRPGYSDPQPGEHASEQIERLFHDWVIVNDGDVKSLRRHVLSAAVAAWPAVA